MVLNPSDLTKNRMYVPIKRSINKEMVHYWQEVLKVTGITGRNPSSRIKDSQIRGRSPSVWELFFLLLGLMNHDDYNPLLI